jgi:hypothetical protein
MQEFIAALPCGYTATFSWDGSMHVAWEPSVPNIRSRRARHKFLQAYAAARREFMTGVAALLGGAVLIVDTDGATEVVQPPSRQ